jgi:hypothetical protein
MQLPLSLDSPASLFENMNLKKPNLDPNSIRKADSYHGQKLAEGMIGRKSGHRE